MFWELVEVTFWIGLVAVLGVAASVSTFFKVALKQYERDGDGAAATTSILYGSGSRSVSRGVFWDADAK